jgi:hypothetical protein
MLHACSDAVIPPTKQTNPRFCFLLSLLVDLKGHVTFLTYVPIVSPETTRQHRSYGSLENSHKSEVHRYEQQRKIGLKMGECRSSCLS